MAFNNDLLIDQETGEVDVAAVAERAFVMACGDYGGPNPPMAYIAPRRRAVADLALAIRRHWRRDNGLPDDTACTMVDVSGWTDTFRRLH